jgi:ribulose 1,5-bisphosphate carboxylase large subunit-like protein
MGMFGNNFVIQAGGGIHGHKNGTTAGARAMRQAMEATLNGKTLDEYAETHTELKSAIRLWKS